MKIFIFKDVDQLTNSYHSEGGLVIVAQDLETAVQMSKDYTDPYDWRDDKHPIKLSEQDIKDVIIYDLKGRKIEPQIYIFPDAGCC